MFWEGTEKYLFFLQILGMIEEAWDSFGGKLLKKTVNKIYSYLGNI